MNFQNEFKNPPAAYRIKPFWFWNGQITREEIRHQIQEMADKGLGGMFICARQGMTLPYLSKEWFDMTVYACDLAREYGLEAWLYDEYPYPSGMSGGEVLLEHPEAEHTVLHHKSFLAEGETEIEADLGWSRVLLAKAFPVKAFAGEPAETLLGPASDAVPAGEGEGGLPSVGTVDWEHGLDIRDQIGNLQMEKIYQKTGLTRYNNKRFFSYGPRKLLRTVLPAGTWKVEIYTEGVMGDFKYYGGFFDPCNEKAVQTFLATTHERYRKALGEQFGVSVHGMFSDEVGLLSPIPWSRLLPEKFKERKGYDLLSCLPALHNPEIKDACRIRYDLYDTAHELFRESYHHQVSQWCRSNQLSYATEVPSMRQGTQKYSDIIGGDTAHEKLGKPLEWIYDEYMKNYRSNAKSVSSLARQLGRKYAMIESFHSLGWTMTLQDAKWMIDRLGSSGINLYNFHAFYYTIQDITKHDAPPSQFLQNPYWKHYRKLADYVGRMGVMVTNTEADISIAVLDPAAALWTKLGNPFHGFPYRGESEQERQECSRIRDTWVHICKTILFAQMDYDHLDAELLAEASVAGGKIRIGRAEYSAVILPPCHCMEAAARKKLEEFVSQGGRLMGVELLPFEAIDEEESPAAAWKALFDAPSAYFLEGEGWEQELIALCREYGNEKISRRVSSGQEKDVITCVRKDEEGSWYLFAANQGKAPVTVQARIQDEEGTWSWMAEEWSLEEGSVKPVPMKERCMEIHLGAFESQWIRIWKIERCSMERVVPVEESGAGERIERIVIPFDGPKAVSLEGKNICRFGTVKMSLDGENWKPVETETFVEQCQETEILEGRNLEFTGDFGTPRRIRIDYPLTCYYQTEFTAEYLAEDTWILMDQETVAGDFRLWINDKPVLEDRWKPVFVNDQNNREAWIGDLIKPGKNQIRFQVTVHKDEEGIRDPFFLRGSFGVIPAAGCPVLTQMPCETEISHRWMKGFPFYSGTICLEDQAELPAVSGPEFELELGLDHPVYDCMEVLVNGHSLGVKAYTPYRWRCRKEWVREGRNQVEVRITNTLANMLDGTYFDYDTHQLMKIEEAGGAGHE
ncbi:MAG: glycosyl hydrolase [Lachnospiraceae bacterium]|nr:glycosyl hydrolase [Lachnospiraceae bacterium]